MTLPALPKAEQAIVDVFALASSGAPVRGLHLCTVTGLSSGAVYPALNRLVDAGVVQPWPQANARERPWQPGGPPRRYYQLKRYYQLTLTGQRLAAQPAHPDAVDAPTVAAPETPPPGAGPDDGSGSRMTSALALFRAAGYDTRRSMAPIAAITYFAREGHLNVPRGHRELGVDLFWVVCKVRTSRRDKKLTPAQIAAWDSIGMDWFPAWRPRLNPQERAEAVRLYLSEEWSIREIAAVYGYSYGGIHKILTHASVRFRASNRPPGTRE